MSASTGLAQTPEPPYFAVIFTSKRSVGEHGYDAMAQLMVKLGSSYEGFLGIESARGADGIGITVSYWRDEASILAWKRDTEHQKAQQGGRARWYDAYQVRVAHVQRAYGSSSSSDGGSTS